MANVDVVYALAEQQTLLSVTVPAGSSIEFVIHASGILTLYPEIDLTFNKVGIFSKFVTSLAQPVQDGDRVEIYRPLASDPTEARRLRAVKRKFKT